MKAKILAALTNREVLELMEERGASNVDLSGTPNGPFLSECKVKITGVIYKIRKLNSLFRFMNIWRLAQLLHRILNVLLLF